MVPPRPPIPPPIPPPVPPQFPIDTSTHPVSTAVTGPEPSDALGKFLQLTTSRFLRLGWTGFVTISRGRCNISPNVKLLRHPAAHFLHHMLSTDGAPAQGSNPHWNISHRDSMIERGSHNSAFSHYQFLRDEMADMIAKHQGRRNSMLG